MLPHLRQRDACVQQPNKQFTWMRNFGSDSTHKATAVATITAMMSTAHTWASLQDGGSSSTKKMRVGKDLYFGSQGSACCRRDLMRSLCSIRRRFDVSASCRVKGVWPTEQTDRSE